MSLDSLGQRICVMGPSNSGKSTLAEAISRSCGLPAVHLDQLYHLPNTDWRPRPTAEFLALHDEAIAAPCWVMDGNYSQCAPRRLERATGLILLDVPIVTSLLRYFRRSLVERDRRGALDGGGDSIKWKMIHHIAVISPGNRRRYKTMFDLTPLPKIALNGPGDLKAFYREAGLVR